MKGSNNANSNSSTTPKAPGDSSFPLNTQKCDFFNNPQDEKIIQEYDNLQDLKKQPSIVKEKKELTEEEKKKIEEKKLKEKELVDFNDLVPGEYYLHVYIEETIELLNKKDPEKTLDVVIKRKLLPIH